MFKKLFFAAFSLIFFFGLVQNSFAQEPEEDRGFILEEEIDIELKKELTEPEQDRGFILEEEIEIEPKKELTEEEMEPQFITALVLTERDVKPAISFYIRSDIERKYSGLIDNLKLEKIYGIIQEEKIASVYFDYRYTTMRNKDKILFEKGKMKFIKFNSGKWFNAELSIYLMDSYPVVTKRGPQ